MRSEASPPVRRKAMGMLGTAGSAATHRPGLLAAAGRAGRRSTNLRLPVEAGNWWTPIGYRGVTWT
jgi:hypothetical protein